MNLFNRMLENERVAGVKCSSDPAQDILRFKHAGGKDFIVFNGPDEQFVAGRLLGADAGIGGTYGAMPELYLKIRELFLEGKMEQAREIQNEACRIIYKMCSAHGNMYGVIKEVLRINEGLELGSVRCPLTPVTEADQEVVQKAASLICEVKKRFL